ncbi:hypothetical protein A2334_00420 [Candidatus Roizmanbacteria bacterium RIFOXYB2_FULL_38_10]|uniref:Uncharacterized protein n=1 Tax=Candidatus Roizmanbacteria bacterium RIFOXYD1_FULL_38_12 TaxID=1802093 RepID=A0A1F7L2C8_9BACT|nr:MAG: hypothetical protein A3K47_05965 [Candidatus Roizmanbacteria bacterium RIFOXYA2_FULL_38_14]OGK64285.1 MAG: hypothetical protein A3K27_05965 [Candidatus Roizmanbacteria bacterium RIFOXYA1_FULL_37_12]OGK66131.1 MAG: hypothetical protein A3K38_05965 [Candidatus Roizmanbacteria bacterium RIFOXYB1_FULL_40_23]OGK67696.1 MAG: hypothetical protein A2334_00420 [Candidatus Roizmanbacteria bacterium RIFOXYB2_FULL_38_10]OGK70536.1 MAG: hypothetical protein A3K21_05970 [Candidatus Roizmanbacteria ba
MNNDVRQIFGTVNAPPGSSFVGNDPVQGVGNLITFFIQISLFVGGIATLIYLLWGAFDWIMSEGQKEKLQKAQSKMMNAVIGLLMIVVAFTIFSFVMGTVLGGKFGIGKDFKITLPQITPAP